MHNIYKGLSSEDPCLIFHCSSQSHPLPCQSKDAISLKMIFIFCLTVSLPSYCIYHDIQRSGHTVYTGYTTTLYIILFIILYSNSFQPLADIKTFMAYDCNLAIWNCFTIKIEWKNCLTCTSKIKEAFTELFGIINCYSSSPETSNLLILQVNQSTDLETLHMEWCGSLWPTTLELQ